MNLNTNEGMFKFVKIDPAQRGKGLGKEMLQPAVLYAFKTQILMPLLLKMNHGAGVIW